MSVAAGQLKVYLRGVIIVAVVVAIGLVLFENRNHKVSFWFFWLTDDTKPIHVIYLMLCTAAGTLASWWTLRMGLRLWRDAREMKRLRSIKNRAKVLNHRAVELDERERRVDRKLRDAIATRDEGDGE